MPTSSSKQAMQLAKLYLSSLSTKTVISFLIEIFRCFNALSTLLYVANAVHADFIVETSPASRKIQSFLDFAKTVISFLIEIFRCFDALSTPFYTPKADHAEFSVETSPATR
jgi:hypothetical protein